MVEHYNAFISYRHAPADSKIAAMVQRSLEHYRIPKAIQQQSGMRRIDRIFRDREELPITFNLNHDIGYALEHSDFLIVICSTSTCQSQWVTKEIETFLKTHNRHQVLTVLVDGEPYDVIPPILFYDEVEQVMPSGETYTERIPLEPLSCDLRGDPKKAMRTELHRMAAPLLGCSYDELVQRQRRYQRQRMMTVMSTLIAGTSLLAAYFFWTSVQIQKSYLTAEQNYQQSLKNQSRYLSAEAITALKNGDRLTALQLAIEALPTPEAPRPFISEAEYAMTKALMAYSAENDRIAAVNLFNHHADVSGFCTAVESRRLWSLDSQHNVYLWNTEDYSLIQMWKGVELEDEGIMFPELYRLSDSRILVTGSNKLRCMNADDGEILWERELPNVSRFQFHLTEDGRELGLFANADNLFYRLNAENGETLDTFPLYQQELPENGKFTYSKFAYSPDGQQIAFTFSYSKSLLNLDGAMSFVGLYDLNTQQWKCTQVEKTYFDDLRFTPEGMLVAAGIEWDGFEESAIFYSDQGTLQNLVGQTFRVMGFDAEQLERRWMAERPFSMVRAQTEILCGGYDDGRRAASEAVCLSFSNKCLLLESRTGEVLAEYELPATILNTQLKEDAVTWVLDSGEFAARRFASNNTSALSVLVGNIDKAVKTDTPFFVVSRDSSGADNILMYTSVPADPNWKQLEGEAVLGYWESQARNEQYYVYLTKDTSNYHLTFNVVDTQKLACTASVDLQEKATGVKACLAGIRDGEALVLRSGYSKEARNELLCFPLDGGEPTETTLQSPYDAVWAKWYEQEQKLFYLTGYELRCVDLTLGEETVIPITNQGKTLDSFFSKNFTSNPVSPELFLLAQLDGGTDYRPYALNLLTGELNEPAVGEADTLAFYAVYSPDSEQAAVPGEDCVQLLDRSGNEICRIPSDGRSAAGVFFLRGGTQLGILYSNQELICYDSTTGAAVEKTVLYDLGTLYLSWNQVEWQELGDGRGILLLHNSSPKAFIIDLEDWDFCAQIDNCLTCLPEQDCFLTGRSIDGRTVLGSIHRYSLPDLLTMARELLGDTAMSEEMRLNYGLG